MPVTEQSSAISVVCPTYNGASFIHRTLDVLAGQEVLPGEIVFADDASSDGTPDLLEAAVPRFEALGVEVKVLRNAHGGVGANRNKGLAAATRPWVAFFDSDDTWRPGKLARICQAMRERPEANFITHWEDYLRLDGSQGTGLRSGTPYDLTKPLPPQVYAMNYFSTSATVCHRSLLVDAGGFDPSIGGGVEDYELWLRISPRIRLACIPEVLGCYLEREGSLTSLPHWRRCHHLLRIYWRHRDKGGAVPFLKRSLRTLLSKQWYFSLKNAVTGYKGHT